MHTIKCFQVFLYNSYNSTLVICLHTQFVLLTLSGATILGQCGPGSSGNEGVHHIPRISKAVASALDCLMSYTGHSLGGVLVLCRDAVGVFYSHS